MLLQERSKEGTNLRRKLVFIDILGLSLFLISSMGIGSLHSLEHKLKY